MTSCNIYPQQPLNKPVHKTFGGKKKQERRCGVPFSFSFQQPFSFVEDLLKAYLVIYQYIIYHIQQFNKISEVFKHVFGDGVIPAHTALGQIVSCTVVIVFIGGVGKTVWCWCELPALLYHLPHLRLLHLDLRADEQRDDVIEAERNRLNTDTCHDVEQQFRHLNLQPVAVASDYLPQGIRLQQLRVEPHAAFLFGGQLSRYLFNKSFILMR